MSNYSPFFLPCLLVWLSSLSWAGSFSRDCFVPDRMVEGQYLQCYSGKKMIEVPAGRFEFEAQTASSRQIELSTFVIFESFVDRRDYFKYLEQSETKASEDLKLFNGKDASGPLIGSVFQEAKDYCDFYGMNLPTEAQMEYLRQRRGVQNLTSAGFEWVQDYFKEPVPAAYGGKNPLVTAVTHSRSLRSIKEIDSRKAGAMHIRSQEVTFRCMSHMPKPSDQQALMNYMQMIPDASASGLHFLKIESQPAGAKVYFDLEYNDYVGKTPIFLTTPKPEIGLSIVYPGYAPVVLHLKTERGFGQAHSVVMKPIGEMIQWDFQREMNLVFVPGGRIRIGLTESEKIEIQNAIASKFKNQDLSQEQIRQYLKPEGPDRIVYVKDFYMDQTEVTNRSYQKYVEQSGADEARCGDVGYLSHPDQPVVCITWDEALNYCRFYGLDLPMEVQFDKASAGLASKDRKAWIKRPQHKGSDEFDISRYSIQDLAGNVMEWMGEWYDEESYHKMNVIAPRESSVFPTEKLIRGSSVDANRYDSRLSKRRHRQPLSKALDLGFRCVKNNFN